MKDNVLFLEKTLGRLLEWVRAADAKIPPVLAIATSMLGVLAALSPSASRWSVLAAILCVLAAVPLVVCLVALLLASFPRTTGPSGSLLYFEGIKSRASGAYLKQVKDTTEDGLESDLAEQCHRNSEIASIKYRFLKVAMASLLVGILPWLSSVFVLCSNR